MHDAGFSFDYLWEVAGRSPNPGQGAEGAALRVVEPGTDFDP